jgi:geranylgeranyl diphosphate synthase type I
VEAPLQNRDDVRLDEGSRAERGGSANGAASSDVEAGALLSQRLDAFGHAIDRYLKRRLEAEPAPDELAGMLRYHLGWVDATFRPVRAEQGKRLRPALCLLVCEAARGRWQDAVPAAAAVELIHNFSLVHDDIEDASPLRRHRPTLWHVWGIPKAINAGDALLVHAQLALADLPVDAERRLRAIALLARASLRLCAGQHGDLDAPAATLPTLAQYYAMIEGKTAALLAAAAELGALVAGCDAPTQDAYGRLGRELGVAFQLQDDLLDVWGHADRTGKPAREDLRNKKRSLPVVLTATRASDEQRTELTGLLEQDAPLAAGQIARLVTMMEALDVPSVGESLVRKHLLACLDSLEVGAPAPAGRALVGELIQLVLGRDA